MKNLILILLIIGLISACCDPMIENRVEDPIQRKYKVDCLRLNNIDFALKDDGTILILGKESAEKINLLDDIIYDASVKRNLDICSPSIHQL